MSVLDWIRIRRTMLAYDFWLDLEGVNGRRRRALRTELVGNLADASAQVGYSRARQSLGSLRALAAAAVVDRDSRPRWVVGLYAASTAATVWAVVTLVAATAFADGALAAVGGTAVNVTGRPFFAPWAEVTVIRDSTLRMWAALNPASVLIPALGAFLLGARFWRIWAHRPATDQIASPSSVSHRRRAAPGASGQLKLSPHAQELPALGLSMVKPCFSIVSAKSIVAPSR